MLSVVIPVKNEARSLPTLYQELTNVLKKISPSHEIIFVNDGSTDTSKNILESLTKRDSHVRAFHFRANFGKSAALSYGLSQTKGEIIVTLDADLQDDPNEISKLIVKLQSGYDVVVGWRKARKDTIDKRLSSFLFNLGTRVLSGVNLHDYNCGLKVMKREVAQKLHLHGELHRFVPILAAKLKYRVTELPVNHRKRRFGISNFGLGRSWRAVIDLLTVLFLTRYEGKPAHFFGLYGFLLTSIGFLMNGYVTYVRVTTGTVGHHIPLLLAGILLMVVGLQLISVGLIAELVTSVSRRETNYL